jgi:hypothetical protein
MVDRLQLLVQFAREPLPLCPGPLPSDGLDEGPHPANGSIDTPRKAKTRTARTEKPRRRPNHKPSPAAQTVPKNTSRDPAQTMASTGDQAVSPPTFRPRTGRNRPPGKGGPASSSQRPCPCTDRLRSTSCPARRTMAAASPGSSRPAAETMNRRRCRSQNPSTRPGSCQDRAASRGGKRAVNLLPSSSMITFPSSPSC